MAVGEARGYEPATSQMRNTAATFCVHWFEPIEEVVRAVATRPEGLLRHGELQFTRLHRERGPGVARQRRDARQLGGRDRGSADLTAGTATRSWRHPSGATDNSCAACAARPTFPGVRRRHVHDTAYLVQVGADPVSTFQLPLLPLVAAALSVMRVAAITHAAAMPLLSHVPGMYRWRWLTSCVVSLADGAKAAAPSEAQPASAELDGLREWLRPGPPTHRRTFGHLVRWLARGAAWAVEDFQERSGRSMVRWPRSPGVGDPARGADRRAGRQIPARPRNRAERRGNWSPTRRTSSANGERPERSRRWTRVPSLATQHAPGVITRRRV